jgi:hypothetical protein
LNEIKKSDQRWHSIPAVFVPKISDRQVAILQGQYHLDYAHNQCSERWSHSADAGCS